MMRMLVGPKSTFEGIRAWLRHPERTLLLWGPTGAGKDYALATIAEEEGYEPEEHEDPLRAIENARHPTFHGKGRYAVVNDADYLTRTQWTKIEKALPDAPPTVIIALSFQSVPWQVRKNCVVIEITKPQIRHIQQVHPDLNLSRRIGWRQAGINAYLGIEPEERQVFVPIKDQPKAILHGEYGHDFDCHPLAVISMAHHNGADPTLVARALTLHSQAWEIEGLSEVSRAFISTLRTDRVDSPPFRKRALKGGFKRL
jgi:hypothetical protein